LTQGKINNNHFYLARHLDFFPAEQSAGTTNRPVGARQLPVAFARSAMSAARFVPPVGSIHLSSGPLVPQYPFDVFLSEWPAQADVPHVQRKQHAPSGEHPAGQK
jgi:hypothetical protein